MLTTQWFTAMVNISDTAVQRRVWVAYSGGVDSHVLLDLARHSFANITVIHINHGLSTLDEQWQQHCETVCAELGLSLQCVRVNCRVKPGQSQENIARIARRAVWRDILQNNDILLLGHHADDQAETVLYRLLRGAGPKGLSGIKAKTKLGLGTLIRPLLSISKKQILEYAQIHNLNWLQDQTNANNNFDRNYIRNAILPVMQQRWPAAIANINRAAILCNNLHELTVNQTAAKLNNILLKDNILDLINLSKESQIWQYEILRLWLSKFNIVPSLQQQETIFSEVINARIDAQPEYFIAKKILKRSNNKLYLLDNNISSNLRSTHGRKAKKIFQQYGIPPWERSNYPLIFKDGKLISIVGLWER